MPTTFSMAAASFPPRARAAVEQAGRYAAEVTDSTIHNFRSYLCRRALRLCEVAALRTV
jgi:hypothetical protein